MKGLSKLDKAKRFIAVYNHMFQMEDCDFCDGGSCNPTTHEHPAIAPRPFDKESSPEIPEGSPVGGGPSAGRTSRTRSTAGSSPTHLIGLGENSRDTPITDNVTHPLVTEQDNADTDVTPEALAARVNQGGKNVSKKGKGKAPAPKPVLDNTTRKSSSTTSSTDSWLEQEKQRQSEESDLTEAEVQAKLDEEAAEIKKAIALKKKKLAIKRANEIADAKRKAKQIPVKSLKQRLEEQCAALLSAAEREDDDLRAAHKQKLKAANRPTRRNTTGSSGRASSGGRRVSWLDREDQQPVDDDDDVFVDDEPDRLSMRGITRWSAR